MNPINYNQSAALLERAKKVLAGGVSSEFRKYNHPHALFYTHGKGTRIYDVDGNEYLDFTLSQGPLILGHSHPEVTAAIADYSRTGQLYAGQHLKEIELAEKMQEIIPSAELIRFCLDGSTAVQTAFRVARAKTGRDKFIRFEGHYHGWLDNVCWGNAAASLEAMGERTQPVSNGWSKGLANASKEESILLPWNDLELVEKTVAEKHMEIAAIITEPVMCNNNCILPGEGFLQGLRDICDRYGIALIFDEVITGFRLGLGGAQLYFGVVPDMSVFAKAMASGYPISAVVGKKEWMHLLENGTVIHAGTMNSGNATIAAALTTIQVLERDKPYERLFALGKYFMEGLRKAAAATGHTILVQGPGPMFCISFTAKQSVDDYRDSFSCDKGQLSRFIAGMHDRGIRIIGRGLVYISTAHKKEEIDHALTVAEKVFKAI
ncbi:MAG: aspartate aminotransferase family protein [Chitinophagaceae bacterium]|nr:aspartate aminotransferase family protein [Chitinophagaceae bacterium]MCW5926778.1 aspartate aminotransferase family protein [Chitinophagaceae bacterium]